MELAANTSRFLDDLLAGARRRAAARGAAHAGDLTPRETAALLRHRAVTLVDVRSEAEWLLVGRVPGARRIEWPTDDRHEPKRRFVAELAAVAVEGAPIVMICRSGTRSERAARAAAEAGLGSVFNMLEGFEGEPDERGRRSSVNGWRHAGLPWVEHGRSVR